MARTWEPFHVDNTAFLAPRPLMGVDGVGDRLRAAAFAEVQAEVAFLWAADTFEDAPEALRQSWRALAREEAKHKLWLLTRMDELKISLTERPVTDNLWRSLVSCTTARDFCHHMAGAEERGRRAGERFSEGLRVSDPITAEIFGKIALEERAHIALAYRFFPEG